MAKAQDMFWGIWTFGPCGSGGHTLVTNMCRDTNAGYKSTGHKHTLAMPFQTMHPFVCMCTDTHTETMGYASAYVQPHAAYTKFRITQ